MKGICALCNQKAELQESHIIPSFVFKWLKETSVTGRFRYAESINKRVQDGAKIHLLCRDCEQLFGKWESNFANKIFAPIHQDQPTSQYGSWLLKFSASVSWRVLTFFRNFNHLNHCSSNLMESMDNALKIWQEFLLGRRPHPDCCELHILPFTGLIKGISNPNAPANLNRYISRAVDMDVFCGNKGEFAYVYTKMCRILLVGFIQMDHRERWRDTKVHVGIGDLPRGYKPPDMLYQAIIYEARKQRAVERKISPRQLERIDKDYRKNSDKFINSEMEKALKHDYLIFGKETLDDLPDDGNTK